MSGYKMTDAAQRTVDTIRGTIAGIHIDDVFVSRSGNALVWVDEDTVVYVDSDGKTSAAFGEWSADDPRA